jgi:hypothetical protein
MQLNANDLKMTTDQRITKANVGRFDSETKRWQAGDKLVQSVYIESEIRG